MKVIFALFLAAMGVMCAGMVYHLMWGDFAQEGMGLANWVFGTLFVAMGLFSFGGAWDVLNEPDECPWP